ncbi:MAG: hypothetical protein GC190_13750 [Alphaproteobacteria bacterium]|nr:hypothetical protein [Alphaproteobacteria bacterium]
MRVIHNPRYSRRAAFVARTTRITRATLSRLLSALSTKLFEAFPPPDPDMPPIAKASALREGAKLSERVDVISKKTIA